MSMDIDAKDTTMTIPLTFGPKIRNMVDHKLVIEIEADAENGKV